MIWFDDDYIYILYMYIRINLILINPIIFRDRILSGKPEEN